MPGRVAWGAVAWGAAATLAASCAAGRTTGDSHRPAARSSAVRGSGDLPIVDVQSVLDAGRPPAEEEPAAPIALPAAGAASTPGIIACGSTACRAGRQVCCYSQSLETGYCASARINRVYCPADDERPGGIVVRCDDKQDCRRGEVCCWSAQGDYSYYACSPPPCETAEVCVGEAGCSDKHRCDLKSATGYTAHRCRYSSARVACGEQVCSGDLPVCCGSEDESSWRCAPYDDDRCRPLRWECLTRADCAPGYLCCTEFSGTHCTSSCGAHGTSTCRTIRDCPPIQLSQPTGCVEASGPPGIKICSY